VSSVLLVLVVGYKNGPLINLKLEYFYHGCTFVNAVYCLLTMLKR